MYFGSFKQSFVKLNHRNLRTLYYYRSERVGLIFENL